MTNSTDRVAVVTGGSLGIGAEISNQLLDLGWTVHVLARHADAYVGAEHERCRIHNVDVRDVTAVNVTAQRVAQAIGDNQLDALILCAGIGYPTPLPTVTRDHYDELFNTNVAGSIFCTQAFAPLLREGEGVIAVISSIAGRRGFADWSLYCAAKHALEGFTASIRDELRPKRIRVTSIQPGSVDTPSYDHLSAAEKSDFMDPATVAALTVHAIRLPPQACVETMFVNNAVGDL